MRQEKELEAKLAVLAELERANSEGQEEYARGLFFALRAITSLPQEN